MKPKLEDVLVECHGFRTSFTTLVMATVNNDARPEASYAPYVEDADGAFYVFISELSQHTSNLREKPTASVLFIEDEAQASHLFSRRRLTLSCECMHVPRSDQRWSGILDHFKQRFGELIDVLRGLEDFHLFRLKPQTGTYVRGFAQAYELTGPDLQAIRHINDKGHRPQTSTASEAISEMSDAE